MFHIKHGQMHELGFDILQVRYDPGTAGLHGRWAEDGRDRLVHKLVFIFPTVQLTTIDPY